MNFFEWPKILIVEGMNLLDENKGAKKFLEVK